MTSLSNFITYKTAKEKGYGQTLTLWDEPMWI